MDILSEKLTSGPPARRSKKDQCVAGDWIYSQPEERLDLILAALEDEKWQSSELYRLFVPEGLNCSEGTFRVHRAGRCGCVS